MVHMNIRTSTLKVAKSLGVSQQTVSRQLIELEKEGYIIKDASSDGVELKVTNRGIDELQKVYLGLKGVFENSQPLIIEGKLSQVSEKALII